MIKFLGMFLLGIATLGFVRTAFLSFGSDQEQFMKGILETTSPIGEYRGKVEGLKTSWVGKKFLEGGKGVNLFQDANGDVSERYPFVTSFGKGSHDYGTDVLRIDYNTKENPWWVRPVLDEVVQIAPGVLLGKMEYRIIPYFPFTILYFRLSQGNDE